MADLIARRTVLARAGFVLAAAALPSLAGCKRKPGERCARCGMKIEPGSAFAAEIVKQDGQTARYDSPRCALLDVVKDRAAVRELRVQEYYGRAWKAGTEVRFVRGSDVEGPMGPEMVPVLPDQVARFVHDHAGGEPFELETVNQKVLDE